MIHNAHSPRSSRFPFLTAMILTVSLAVAMPAFGAEPEEADPDPFTQTSGSAVTQELVVADFAELDTDRLAPGRYVVRVVDAEGTKAVFEIVVKR